ncbi:MAG: hypothetical protein ACFFDF_24410 [Candidatus Odinarchaeota archaeon]
MNEFIISFIVGGLLLIWCIIFRYSENGKVEGQPLGMPKGTVRALIALMLVTFPFGYMITGNNIPGLVVNVIFVVVAFYFEARRGEGDKLQQIVNEIKRTRVITMDVKKEKKPLYLPKYSVRILQVLLLLAFITINWYGGNPITLETTNTIFDLIIIIALFVVGVIFRSILRVRAKNRIKEKIADMDASLSEDQIIEKLMLEPSSWERTGKTVLSIIMLILVLVALTLYSYDLTFPIANLLGSYDLSVVGILLLLINAYYGFRD